MAKATKNDTELAIFLAGENMELVNVSSKEIAEFTAADFENTGATKIELEPEQAYMGVFESLEMAKDERNDNEFCVVHSFNFGTGEENFITTNRIYKSNFEKIQKGQIFIIGCTGKDKNEKGEYKKYSISMKKQA